MIPVPRLDALGATASSWLPGINDMAATRWSLPRGFRPAPARSATSRGRRSPTEIEWMFAEITRGCCGDVFRPDTIVRRDGRPPSCLVRSTFRRRRATDSPTTRAAPTRMHQPPRHGGHHDRLWRDEILPMGRCAAGDGVLPRPCAGLPATTRDYFKDDAGLSHERHQPGGRGGITRLRRVRFCPFGRLTPGVAAFLYRALARGG